MTTLEEMDKAIELAEMFTDYATPERYIKALKAIDKDVYEDVMSNAQDYLETSHNDAYKKVKTRLIGLAEADKEQRDKRAEKARNRRAEKKSNNVTQEQTQNKTDEQRDADNSVHDKQEDKLTTTNVKRPNPYPGIQ